MSSSELDRGRFRTPKGALERLVTAERVPQEWFSSAFLAQVSVSQIEQLLDTYKGSLGPYQEVKAADDKYLVVFNNGTVPTKISVNHEGVISGLFFQPPQTS